MEPDIELFLAEISDIVRLIFSGGRFIVYQEYEDVVQDAKAFLELLFK